MAGEERKKYKPSIVILMVFVFGRGVCIDLHLPTPSDDFGLEELSGKLKAENAKLSVEPRDADSNQIQNINATGQQNFKELSPFIPSPVENRELRTLKVEETKKDSYLAALDHSQTSKDPKEGIVDVDRILTTNRPKYIRRQYVTGPIYSPQTEYGAPQKPDVSYGPPSNNIIESIKTPRIVSGSSNSYTMTPSSSYSLPVQSSGNFNENSGYSSYNAPQSGYNYSPAKQYGPPKETYGTPANNYYAPPQVTSPQQAYGVPASTYGLPYGISGMPSLPTIDFSWPFALKLDAFTIAKIILKLVIFKLIVKFIAIICLLLFIPKLEMKKDKDKDEDADNEEGRSALNGQHISQHRLNLLTALILNSVDKYTEMNSKRSKSEQDCDTWQCRFMRIFNMPDTWQELLNLLNSYIMEEKMRKESKTVE